MYLLVSRCWGRLTVLHLFADLVIWLLDAVSQRVGDDVLLVPVQGGQRHWIWGLLKFLIGSSPVKILERGTGVVGLNLCMCSSLISL